MAAEMFQHRPAAPVSLLACVVALAAALGGCAGASLTRHGESLGDLAARQRALASSDAGPEAWAELASDFERLATTRGIPAETREQAEFGACVSHVYSGDGAAAVSALGRFVARYPISDSADDALRLLADEYARDGRATEQLRALRQIVNDHPESPHAADAWAALWPADGAASAGYVAGGAPSAGGARARVPDIAPTIVQELGLGIRTVVVDPGHGGEDPGGTAAGRPREKEIALDVALRLAEELRGEGLTVMLTRDVDVFVPLGERNAMAISHGADLFVSLHVNHAENLDAQGAETWIAAPARDERSALVAARENLGAGSTSELADYVSQLLSDTKTEESRALAEAIQAELVGATGATDRGVKEAGFVVLLGLRVPSALVEMGFLTNAVEAELLSQDAYRQTLAEGIAAGIVRYVRSHTYIP